MSVDEATRRAIAETAERYVKARLAGDVEAQLSVFSDDIVGLAPGAPPIEGKATVRQYLAEPSTGTLLEYIHEWKDPTVAGRFAHQWGRVYSRFKENDGRISRTIMWGVRVLEQRPTGEWLIKILIWNEQSIVYE